MNMGDTKQKRAGESTQDIDQDKCINSDTETGGDRHEGVREPTVGGTVIETRPNNRTIHEVVGEKEQNQNDSEEHNLAIRIEANNGTQTKHVWVDEIRR